ncbi:MAG: phage head-tail connector protein [Hungatella sp.]|jgi:hypothetical protein|nr:phage head-tail connector protein [Hungatella sp.]
MELGKLKKLLGIAKEDISQDPQLTFILEDVEETVKNHCHIKSVPEGLINTCYRMAVDLYRHERPGEGEAPVTVTSISEGDTKTSFSSAANVLQGSILKNYKAQLNRYRKTG